MSVETSRSRLFDILLTALAPISWGTTYVVATEFLPPGHPLLVASMRSLPIGLLLVIGLRKLPTGIWWLRMLILGSLNIGVFQACCLLQPTDYQVVWRRRLGQFSLY